MKKKFTFFGICVLLCTLMISVGSCQKDYSDEIDNLQAQINTNKDAIAALNNAIASGSVITNVTQNATGWLISFSGDINPIQVNHGGDGAKGDKGDKGDAGAIGADGFTPIIGIDADGYWTVITTQGGTAVRIKNAGGNDVMAEFSKELGIDVNGMLTVGGVATTVQMPVIIYNSVTKQLTVTVKDENGVLTAVTVAVSEDTFLATDVTSIVSPIGLTKTLLTFGYVPAKVAASYPLINPSTATLPGAEAALAYAGKTWNDLLRSSGKLPVIVNPAQAKLTGFTFDIIKQDGSAYAIQPGAIAEGFDGAFAQFAAAPSNGLYTLPLNPTKAQALTASTAALYPAGYAGGVAGESYQLAVRATKDGREVISGYQYAIKVQEDANTVYTYLDNALILPAATLLYPTVATDPFGTGSAPSTVSPIIPWKVYVPLGTTKNLLDFYAHTTAQTDLVANITPQKTLKNSDFFKSSISIIPHPGNTDVSDITIANTSVTTPATTATVSNLNDKTLPFKLTTFDWKAMYWTNEKNISVVFYSALNNVISPINLGNQVLTDAVSPADQKVALLQPMFTQLDAVGKTELWRAQATNVRVVFYRSNGTTVMTPAAIGISYQFRDANNNTVLGPNATATALADVQAIRKIEFTFDENVALPGSYIAKLEFNDRRAYAAGSEFKLNMPFTISNPDMSTIINKMKEHKANLFTGDLLTVYGTYPSLYYPTATAQFNSTTAYYELFNAYSNLYDPSIVFPAVQQVPVGWWQFKKVGTTPTTNPLVAGTLVPTATDQFNIIKAHMYTAVPYNVELWFYYFGNTNNKELVETIKVKAHSEVYDGSIEVTVPNATAYPTYPTTLQVVNGDVVTSLKLSAYLKVKDVVHANLNAFGLNNAGVATPIDPRIDPTTPTAAATTGVVVKNESITGNTALAHLITVSPSAPDWTITANTTVSVIVADIAVPITIEVTDLFGITKKYETTVLVKKP
ncbi:MAG: hypothetical protein WCR71_01115 [Bacteroidales bacterium]